MAIVSNSGPLLSFARVRRFDLLREVIGTLTIPEAVYADIVVRGTGKRGAEDVQLQEFDSPLPHSVDGVPGGISSLTACRAWAREW
jgi:hypothetical protein